MKSKIISAIILCLIFLVVFVVSASSELSTLRFLDNNSSVLTLKKDLIDAGYLDESESNNSVYNKKTKDSISSIQKDFGLKDDGIASPEVQIIVMLLSKINGAPIHNETNDHNISIPDLVGLNRVDAADILKNLSLFPVIEEDYSDSIKMGHLIKTHPSKNSNVKLNSKITLYISKGPKFILSKNSTWYAWWIKGSRRDNYIPLDATLNSSYKYRWRGYGTAAINDTFDKVVPIEVLFESEEIKKGETQKVLLKIPIRDLNVQFPTTLSVKIELYRNQKTEESLRIDFTMTW